MNEHVSQPRAIYYVVVLQIWEYFNFYGMRALLVLYLANQLKYSNNHAHELFSVYCSLVYVAPILDGFLADKILGSHIAVILGALLMTIGHVVLGASKIHPLFLYLSLAIIVRGYDLFRSSVGCLFGELYEPTGSRRDGGLSLAYVAGDVGSIIALITCGFTQEEYSWTMGFGLAAMGMIAGLVTFLCGDRHFIHTRGVNEEALRATNPLLPNWGWLLVLLAATPVLITVLFWKEWSVYALIVATIASLGVLAKTYRKAENQKWRKELGLIVTLTSFSMLSWALAQRGDSPTSLYADRFVNRDIFGHTAPTAMFQPVSTFAVILCGVFLARVAKESVAGNRTVRIWGEFALGLGLMSAGLCILTLSARWPVTYSYSSLSLTVLDLVVIGFTELSIDPIAMSQITRIEIPSMASILTGIYMLLSGTIVSYLVGMIADWTSQALFDASGMISYSTSVYIEVFDQITWDILARVGLVLMIWLYQALKLRNRVLTLEL